MAAPAVAQLLTLDVEERLRIVQDLWDSIVDDPALAARVPVSAADRALLADRAREDDDDPEGVVPWSAVRDELLAD